MSADGAARRAWRMLAWSRRQRGESSWAAGARDLAQLAVNLAQLPTEIRQRARWRDESRPVLFVVGAPRSGSTLVSQLAARCFDVAYVSNAVAASWLAPTAAWHRRLRRGPPERGSIPLVSRHGATAGADSPHEFGYFWRTWMDCEASDELDEAALARCAWSEIRATCEALAGRFGASLVMKNLNATSFQIEALASALPQSRFLHVTRERAATVESVLAARRAHGDERRWWSVRPAAHRDWADLPARQQVERQVDAVRQAIARAFAALPSGRRLEGALEELRANPRSELVRLAGFIAAEPRLERLPSGALDEGT